MSKPSQFSPEVRERAVRLVCEQRGEHPSLWAAVETIVPMIGCSSQTLLGWVKRDQIDSGEREGVSTSERERLKTLERENKELRRANEILKLASAFFAQAELDRPLKSRRPSSINIATPSGSSRSARSCGLPRRAIGVMPHSFAIRRGAVLARYAMNVCNPRSSVSGRPTCRCTARIRSGSR